MDEIFRSGTLEMSSTPLEAVVEPSLWTDVLTNRILLVLSLVLILHHLLDLFRLTPPLLYSYSRSRGAEALEQSLGTARVRSSIALSLTLPFCLILDRFHVLRPAFMDMIPAEWSAPATIGLILAYLILRRLCYLFFRLNRLDKKTATLARHNLYNYLMLVLPILLLQAAVMVLVHVPDETACSVMRWTLIAVWVFAIGRTGQILHAHCSGFSTFLYLCALEILPASVLVAVVVNF